MSRHGRRAQQNGETLFRLAALINENKLNIGYWVFVTFFVFKWTHRLLRLSVLLFASEVPMLFAQQSKKKPSLSSKKGRPGCDHTLIAISPSLLFA
jgi:hypothetical protein